MRNSPGRHAAAANRHVLPPSGRARAGPATTAATAMAVTTHAMP